ncbi:MAG: NAD-dependent epimerase/dehydratase family protein [Clostridia bacterium]|nr:NAD-dependent epimerase/dehydratase family protein [Clostridia bacterium]
MERRKRILLLGGTGVLGKSLAPELLRQGYEVAITSRSAHTSNERGIMYLRGNAKDDAFLKELLAERFDAVVDFMIYTTDSFAARMQTLLNATQHYIFLSSYRVYGDSEGKPITEQSPRLLDVLDDPEYLKTDEYGLTKARQEDLLRRSGHGHFTIVRPAITYGGDRFQLGTMEANEFLVRALKNEPVIFPREMLDKQATMTWSGDVGTMIARLVLNERAFGETYTAATAEHHSWGEVLELYRQYLGMQVKIVSLDTYRSVVGRPWQIKYDRMLDRVIDNTKILTAANLRQTELMPLSDGLRIELGLFVRNPVFKPADVEMQKRFDRAARE